MAKNCSTDVSLVINHVDSVLSNGTAAEIHALKEMFGLQDLEHNDDFARYICFLIRYCCTRLTSREKRPTEWPLAMARKFLLYRLLWVLPVL